MPEPNWNTIRFFRKSEFPDGIWDRLDSGLIPAVDQYRRKLGRPIYPTPLKEGFVRMKGDPDSRHYAVTRLSDAGDFFPDCDIVLAWEVAVQSGLFGGIGIYWDTMFHGKPCGMLHLDLRPERIWWARVTEPDGGRRYIYPVHGGIEREKFYALLFENELKPPKA